MDTECIPRNTVKKLIEEVSIKSYIVHCSRVLGLGALIGHLKKTIRDHTKKKEENKVSSTVKTCIYESRKMFPT